MRNMFTAIEYVEYSINCGWSYSKAWSKREDHLDSPDWVTLTRREFRAAWEAAGGRFHREARSGPENAETEPAPVYVDQRGIFARVETGTAPEELVPDARPVLGGKLKAPDEYRPTLRGRRFVFTSAQNNSEVNLNFWQALMQFCKENNAQLAVSRYLYNKAGWQKNGGQAVKQSDESDDIWYDPKITPYLLDEQVKVCNGLVFCGELDILPTAVTPLNGLDNYTGENSAIVPHAKMQLKSLATMKHEDAKFLYTTGTVTLRNYIERRAGQIASYHHVYGALFVEIDDAGRWFARQLNADDNGVFFDLDKVYTPHGAYPASEVGRPTVTLGDIHAEKLDSQAFNTALDMLKVLNPENVILHDLLDFTARNHHNKRDPVWLYKQHVTGKDSVVEDIKDATQVVNRINTLLSDTVVYCIRSNHDVALIKWLKEGSTFIDPVNQKLWHHLNWKLLDKIDDPKFDIYEWTLKTYGDNDFTAKFILEDESLVINGIEYGLHGHLGPNGARGNPKAYRQLGRRANTGHTHSAGIIDGVWTAGVLGKLDMDYNVGPSSWSHSNIITYPNGKRQIVTQRGTKWRA